MNKYLTEEMIEDFGNNLIKAAMKALMKTMEDGVVFPYESRFKVPTSFFAEVWKKVDMEKVQEEMAKNIEKTLADKITNKLAAEISTDIKQLLSDKERRESIRAYARLYLDDIAAKGRKDGN